jgi:H/ACA ribonucleoprotein complex subunit 1
LIFQQIPYFNAPIFLENKTQVGKIEEIFGPINKGVGKACGDE